MTVSSPARVPTEFSSEKSFWIRLKRSFRWYPFIVVNLVIFALFSYIPYVRMLELSVLDWDMLGAKKFVGIGNFARMTGDRLVGMSLKVTFYYVLMYVPPLVIISLFVAILVNRELPGMKLFRSLYFLPNVTSIAVLSMVIWNVMGLRPDAPLNYLLGRVGIPAQEWFIDKNLALPSVAGVGIWGSFGYYMVIWLAGLQGVPSELYDAAKVDGADGWKLHWFVTLPMLRPTAAFIIVVTTMGALQVFGSIFMLTNGGPVYRTTTITYHIYSQAFNFYRMGYASAISIVLFLIILVITLVQARLLRFSQEIY